MLNNALESPPSVLCVDFFVFLINLSDVTYKIVDIPGLISLEFLSGKYKVNGTELTAYTPNIM